MIHDAQDVEVYHGEGAHGEDPFHGYCVGVEDAMGPSDLEASKKSSGKAGIPRTFNEAQQALNRLSQSEAEIRGLIEERDTLKLLSEQREGEARGLRAELEAARKEHTNLSEQFGPAGSAKARYDWAASCRVDAVKAGTEEWIKNMDRLASEKEATRAQLASVETQLRSSKEKALVQAKNIEEFQSRLGSVTSDREKLALELAAAKSEVEIAMANADAMVVIYRSDAEVAQVVEHAKCQSRRETLEEIRARGFDLIADIENAKELEAEARVLAFPDDDDTGSMSGSESEEGLESEDVALGED
ncbi:uncharacterized protein [Nicotiana tomentosiformis]|uniref:uncharacterized protein n=1 Tax=Nicotiana tomentosiformis TaxID=4098 RepID=UPI00388C33FD